jgi:hypothetical protein
MVSMYWLDSSSSAFRSSEMLRASPTSSTVVSGHTSFISSAFSTTRPRRSSSTCSVSIALGTSGTTSPCRNSSRCSAS